MAEDKKGGGDKGSAFANANFTWVFMGRLGCCRFCVCVCAQDVGGCQVREG